MGKTLYQGYNEIYWKQGKREYLHNGGGGLIPGMHGIENIMEFLPNVGNLHQQARAL